MEISQEKESGCGLGKNIRAKLGPVLSKKTKETGISMEFFSYFVWGTHLQARISGYRNTWEEIES